MAGVSMRGSDEALKKLQKRLDSARSRPFRRKLYGNLAQEALTQVAISFASESDPYGRRWKPVKRVGQILTDSGRLRNSFRVSSNIAGWTIANSTIYAAVHQYGYGPVARRSYLPYGGRIGTRWRNAFTSIARMLMRMELGQARGG